MRIHCLQHVPFEGPAGIEQWAAGAGHSLAITSLFDGGDPPEQRDFDWLLVMGGPMGVHDEADCPWLAAEKKFLRETISAGKTIIGICLGAQLIADVLGARVFRNDEREIGWFPVELTDQGRASEIFRLFPDRLDVFHWHGDTFDLPDGAVHLARSEGCEHQAFLYEQRVLGVQFHMESTPGSVADIVSNCGDEIVPARYVQDAGRLLSATEGDYVRIHRALFGILDQIAACSR